MEAIRIWAYEVPAYEAAGWKLSYIRRGFPCELIHGPGYADCMMVREVRSDHA